jgi:von Willebrand factor type D domain
MSLSRLAALVAVAGTAFGTFVPLSRAEPLVPPPNALPGFHPQRASSAQALAVAPASVRRSLHRARRPVVLAARGGTDTSGTLLFGVWSLTSRTRARLLATRWRRAYDARSRHALAGGAHGFILVGSGSGSRSRSRRPTIAVWWLGRRLGTVSYTTRKASSNAGVIVRDYALDAVRRARLAAASTPWSRVSERVARRGTLTVPDGIAAFHALGGGRVSSHDRGSPGRGSPDSVDGTTAFKWLLATYSRFPQPLKRRAAALIRAGRTLGPKVADATAARVQRPRSSSTGTSDHGEILARRLRNLQAHLGPLTMSIHLKPSAVSLGIFDAITEVSGSNDTVESCNITTDPEVDTSQTAGNVERILTHELAHCYTGMFVGVKAYRDPIRPRWVIEGLADWMALVALDPRPKGVDLSRYTEYDKLGAGYSLTHSGLAYEAAAWFGMLSDITTESELWKRVSAVFRAASTGRIDTADRDAALAAMGSYAPEVLNHWGPARAGRPDLGPSWVRSHPVPNTLIAGGSKPFIGSWADVPISPAGAEAAPQSFESSLYKILPTETLFRIDTVGGKAYGFLRDAHGLEFGANARPSTYYCAAAGGCKCPRGLTGTVPDATQVALPFYAGLAGGIDAGRRAGLRFTAVPYSEFCHSKATGPLRKSAPLPCAGRVGCGSSNGEPHLQTFDGTNYDFQAAGEFTLVRSVSGGFEVQTRQEPLPGSRDVSINTAVGMRVGSARISVTAGKAMTLRVNGKRRRFPRVGSTVPLAAGGEVAGTETSDGPSLDVVWPDGSQARVWSIGPFGLGLVIAPAATRAGRVAGLLGNADGNQGNDFVTRSGRKLLTRGVGSGRLLYRTFGESWRIAQKRSLLHYPRGKTTASYTHRRFPRVRISLRDIPLGRRRRAEAICRSHGVTHAKQLHDCIFDVALTHRLAFARTAAEEQHAAGATTAWTRVPGFEHLLSPIRIAPRSSGALTLVGGNGALGGRFQLIATDVDAAGRLSAATPLAPGASVDSFAVGRAPTGAARVVTLAHWSTTPPVGLPESGILAFDRSDDGWSGTRFIESTRGVPVATVLGPGDVPYTVVKDIDGHDAVFRGSGSGVTHATGPGDPSCSTLGEALAATTSRVWVAWMQAYCADTGHDGLFTAPIDSNTGAIGSSIQLPFPPGFVGSTFAKVAMTARPGTDEVWVAYPAHTRVATDSHLLLWRIGAPAPVDTGIRLPLVVSKFFLVPAPSGRLWLGFTDDDGHLRLARTGPANAKLEPRRFLLNAPAGTDTLPAIEAAPLGEGVAIAGWLIDPAARVSRVWLTTVMP